jgi:hypothetical protein
MVKYTKEEIKQLKEISLEINNTGDIPHNHKGLVWNRYKEISGNLKEPRPCNCKGSAAHWYKASMAIATYLDELEGNETI